MNVIFDVSLLGPTMHRPFIYSGIARVVDNYANQLVLRKDIDVVLYAGDNLAECLRLWNGALRNRILLPKHAGPITQSIIFSAGRFLNTTLDNRSLAMRAARYATRVLTAPVRKSWARVWPTAAPDVFHTPFGPIPDFVKDKTKLFITIYDLTPRLFPQWTTKEIIDQFNKIFDTLDAETYCLCISKSTRDDLCLHASVDPSRCSVIYLAAEPRFRPCTDSAQLDHLRTKYKIPDGKILLSLSALEPRKNIPTIIKAFTKLVRAKEIPDTYLVLAGQKSWKFDEIFALAAADEMVRRRIVFTGFVDDNDMPVLYSLATAFVYVSFYEGFGLPVLEAMQCGAPVITSNCSSLPEVAGKAALMVDPKDIDAIAATMLTVLENSAARQQLRNGGLERARLFSWQRTVDKTIRAYEGELQDESEINP